VTEAIRRDMQEFEGYLPGAVSGPPVREERAGRRRLHGRVLVVSRGFLGRWHDMYCFTGSDQRPFAATVGMAPAFADEGSW
jgi:hypothetical protein